VQVSRGVGLLDKVYYLSTVPRRIPRRMARGVDALEQGRPPGVISELNSGQCVEAGAEPTVFYLPIFSNYLNSPQTDCLRDSWTLGANLSAQPAPNWTVLLPILMAIVAVPYICSPRCALPVDRNSNQSPHEPPKSSVLILGGACHSRWPRFNEGVARLAAPLGSRSVRVSWLHRRGRTASRFYFRFP